MRKSHLKKRLIHLGEEGRLIQEDRSVSPSGLHHTGVAEKGAAYHPDIRDYGNALAVDAKLLLFTPEMEFYVVRIGAGPKGLFQEIKTGFCHGVIVCALSGLF